MNCRQFSVKGTDSETGEKKTRRAVLPARLEPSAENFFSVFGGALSAPLEWTEIPHDPPTRLQLDYAARLGIVVPAEASQWDVNTLLGRKLNNDPDPDPGLVEFATNRNLVFSRFVGKKALYNLIFFELPLRDRIAFFCFSVYRLLYMDSDANLDASPRRDIFYEFADLRETDAGFLDAMRLCETDFPRFFRSVRILRDEAGPTTQAGGSGTDDCRACRAAAEFLEGRLEAAVGRGA